ncbi:MAG: outer membrane beta-barrel protein [Hoeflea sp.]|uniref:outer membrane beta-barrel protein n=1 Tax=Hoeflea sp. TaxID=1940281 RepID=UPI0032EAF624
MRHRDTRKRISATASRSARCVGATALCLLAGIVTAHAQSAGDREAPRVERLTLRGTTTQSTPAGPYRPDTLYGALPRTTQADQSGFASTDSDDTDAAGDAALSEITTGTIRDSETIDAADAEYSASLARQNRPAQTVDGLPDSANTEPDGVPGFMIGALTLRPTLSERIVRESVKGTGYSTSRVYSETTLSGTLNSNWSRHRLSVTGSGTWQENLSGTGTESPNANLDAALRLDLVNDISATIGAGYTYTQESRTDPNAIFGASTQSGIHEARASLGLQKDLGVLRGTTTLELTRTMYGDATLAGGNVLSADDRDTLGTELTARVGYAVSPALIPFLEASVGREKYDRKVDSTGARRSSSTYGLRAGAEIDLGEKLSGEISAGYLRRSLDDPNLNDISGLTLDGRLGWSPQRGTNLDLGVATTVEAATTAGESGAVLYEFDSTLTHELNSALVARLGTTLQYRAYDSGSSRSNQRGYGASAGLTWNINRYLDLDADASYERTEEPGQANEETTRVGIGLRARR